MTTFLRATCLLSLLVLAGAPRPALASQLQITFEEMTQTSDLIFIGTAGSQSARFNDSGPGGNVVAQDDDGGAGLNSRIPTTSGEFMLPTTGPYTVEITSYATHVTGSFTLNSTSTLPIGSGNVTAAKF